VGASTGARLTVSPRTPGRRFASPFLHRRAPMDDRSMSRTVWREMAAMARSSTSRGKGRLFTPFPAVSQLLPVMQIHFRSHADIYTHSISLIYGILRHSGLSQALFQVLPVSEFYFRSNTRDRKWNANKSVSLAPAIISLQCRLRASSRDFALIVSKMAAKTTSGSGFDRKFGLVAAGFLIKNAFLTSICKDKRVIATFLFASWT